MNRDEHPICGLAAVRARFQRDAGSIVRLFFDAPTARRVGVMCRALAAARKVYRCVEPAELERVAGTVHHGGIVAVVRADAPRTPSPGEVERWIRQREPVLLLDGVGNAHNLGALARTAAFFGVAHLVLAEGGASARPGEAAYRVAEGGLEQLAVWRVADLAAFIGTLRAGGMEVVGAATRGGAVDPPGGGKEGARALVLGNEEHGLSDTVAAACSRRVTIPGAGRVESLNVSAAGAILLWELFGRPRGPRTPR
jgi:RNA methyltransferase, TrmH family